MHSVLQCFHCIEKIKLKHGTDVEFSKCLFINFMCHPIILITVGSDQLCLITVTKSSWVNYRGEGKEASVGQSHFVSQLQSEMIASVTWWRLFNHKISSQNYSWVCTNNHPLFMFVHILKLIKNPNISGPNCRCLVVVWVSLHIVFAFFLYRTSQWQLCSR